MVPGDRAIGGGGGWGSRDSEPGDDAAFAHSPSAPASAAQLKIPGYRIEGVLGRGATGIVYSAVQLAVDRPVAIKVLHADLVGTGRAIRRLQREARTAARLAHPGIISAIDMGERDGRWWYAMELVEGISLAERLAERGPLTEREALRLFCPLCDALQHLYEGGVVHRDIKPANILINERGRARLVDLGLAFPGKCADAGDFVACINALVKCRVCLVLDAMDGMRADCDAFDDALPNASCTN